MTLHTFKSLDEPGQIRALARGGAYLIDRRDADGHYLLYHLDNFYVEIKYGQHHTSRENLHVFDDVDYLDPYLDRIEIGAIL
ncbi:MAG TPA: hypothetical protein VGM41_06535 [Chitinophagaceae bacterium]|jgi:hypothetical protein